MRSCSTALLAALAATLAVIQPAAATPAPTGGAYHLYRPGLRITPPAATPGAATMLYYGGPVIASVKVVAVTWGGTVDKSVTSRLTPYFRAMVNSTYIDQLAQYSTNGLTGVNGHPGTNQTITRGNYIGKFRIRPKNKSTTLTDADVQTELKGQIASGALPAADLNTLYMIYFPRNITITLGSAKSCVSFGAYHEAVSSSVTPDNVFYGVMPDCGGGVTSATIVSSHEFAEAITDAIPTPGSNPDYPQAWNTSDGFEIGDLCEGHITTLTAAGEVYRVQEVFTNSTNACATGKFTSP